MTALLTTAAIREAERRAVTEVGIPTRLLMENAGRAAARELLRLRRRAARRAPGPPPRALLVCGGGGNGGDGLVALRTLAAEGCPASAILLSSSGRLHPDTQANLEAALALDLPVTRVETEEEWKTALGAALGAAPPPGAGPGWVVVDALLGTGAEGPLRGLAAAAVRDLSPREPGGAGFPGFADFDGPVLRAAVDLPTGVSPDRGGLPGPVLRADLTIALAAPRPCHFVSPAAEACGEVRVVEIGIPARFLTGASPEADPPLRLLDRETAAGFVPARPPGARKGQLGRLLLVAGSRRMPGAAALAAEGALRSGVGLLTVAAPPEAFGPLPPEAMRLPLPADAEGEITEPAAEAVLREAAGDGRRPDAIAIGPGLGRRPGVRAAVRRIASEAGQPTVLDADGLHAYAGDASALSGREGLALTPHPGEAARLLGAAPAEVEADRVAAARRLAAASGAAVVLKGRGAVVAEPGGAAFVNRAGGSELAGGGSGDVLTGVVGAFLARGVPPAGALAAGAFTLGRAGEIARRALGAEAVTASDAAARLGLALRGLAAGRRRSR